MRRVYLYSAIVVVVAIGAFFLWPSSSASTASYRTEAVSRGSVAQAISANGTLKPVKVVNVGAQISGRIAALHADFNDNVVEGQTLAELDDSLLKAQLAQSEAQLASAEASCASLCANWAFSRESSSSASVWPSTTLSLKSACSAAMRPEIWAPTFTTFTGFNVPLAEIACATLPRLTASVR